MDVALPKKGIYTLTLLKFFYSDLKLEGKIVPVLSEQQMKELKPRAFDKRALKAVEKPAKRGSFYPLIP